MPRRLSRRRFLQSAAAVTMTPWGRTPGADAPGSPKPPPSERLRVAMIGVTRQGHHDMQAIAAAGAEIAVLCDVDEANLAAARRLHPAAQTATDYRRVMDLKDIDAVAIATPDHSHAIPTLLALQAGKHVFCEKPLTHTVAEARAVAAAAAKAGRVTQMGTQIHAGENYRRVVELVRAGAVGPIREVYLWVRSQWANGDVPADAPPAPAGLHFDLWLGPAADRPYHPAYLPRVWRGWWDFGGGALADMGCHYYDLVQWALELPAPARVTADGPPVHPHSTPAWLAVRYDYPARGSRPALTVHWNSSRKPPEHADLLAKHKWGDGVLFVGDKGMLLAAYTKHKLLPEDRFADYQRPAPSIPPSVGHYKEWVEACKTGGPTTCHFGYAGPLTETVLLGNVAYRAGTPVEWDAANQRIPNAPQAERFLRHAYRAPWGRVIESA